MAWKFRNPVQVEFGVDSFAKLAELIAAFDDPQRPYLSIPHPARVPRFSDYSQLARRAEWSEAGDE